MREWIDALNSAISTELNNQPGREVHQVAQICTVWLGTYPFLTLQKKAHKGSVIDNVTSVQQSKCGPWHHSLVIAVTNVRHRATGAAEESKRKVATNVSNTVFVYLLSAANSLVW